MAQTSEEFFARHRGGSGAVVLSIAFVPGRPVDRYGIFSEIELAKAWANSLPEPYVTVHAPFIVDDPDWGNEAGVVKTTKPRTGI